MKVTVNGGRTGRAIAADDAGECKILVDEADPLKDELTALGCSNDQVMAVMRLRDMLYEVYGSRSGGSGAWGSTRGATSGGIEDVVNEPAYRRYREALRWIAPHQHVIYRLITGGGYLAHRQMQIKAGIELLVIHFERTGW